MKFTAIVDREKIEDLILAELEPVVQIDFDDLIFDNEKKEVRVIFHRG